MERFFTPLVTVIASIIISVVMYLAISVVYEIEDFMIGLILSIIIPTAVSLPISVVMLNYLNKIKEQKAQLEKLNAMNKKLFSLISHDIRSPVLSLKGMVDMVTSGHLNVDESKTHFEKLSTKINSVLQFLNDLLEWSKMQTENKPPEYSLINCEEVIKSTFELLDEISHAKSIQLKIGDLNNTIYADKDSYAFVLRNIYHNAIKFSHEHGEIEVYTELIGKDVYTVIKDSGSGISEDHIDEILDEGKWFTQKGTSDELGSGFGISNCINYLNKNNGKLLIESELNHGAKISIVLPNTHSSSHSVSTHG